MDAMRCKQLTLVDIQGKKHIDLESCYLRMQLQQLQRHHHHWRKLQLMLSWNRGSCDRRSSYSPIGVFWGLPLPLRLLHYLHMKASTADKYHSWSATGSAARARAVNTTAQREASSLVCSEARQHFVPSGGACVKVHTAMKADHGG